MGFSDAEKEQLLTYVSNVEKNVYTIFNLPEEVIAVIFAYVSRSPKGFRENLWELMTKDALVTGGGNQLLLSETAKRFHERWVVGYGHSSVAEHAVAHVGIEKISRLASAELELATGFNSFTEYSQRYQRPGRGGYYIPEELQGHPAARQKYIDLQEKAYDLYQGCFERLLEFLLSKHAKEENESDRGFVSRMEKLAFEDARYVLTLATHTNLGLTGNGRSLRDTLVVLLSSPYSECRSLAREIEKEISRVVPTLLRHVQPSHYLQESGKVVKKQISALRLPPPSGQITKEKGPEALLRPFMSYEAALDHLLEALFVSHSQLDFVQTREGIGQMALTLKEELVDAALRNLSPFDNPLPLFEQLGYRLYLTLSEANWHQLLRHNRKTQFAVSEPGFSCGYTIPPNTREAGLSEEVERYLEEVETTTLQIAEDCPGALPYCVTNAHRRRVVATASLWELYHLVNLRTSPEAQWDIRDTFEQIHRQLTAVHPALARYAKRRN